MSKYEALRHADAAKTGLAQPCLRRQLLSHRSCTCPAWDRCVSQVRLGDNRGRRFQQFGQALNGNLLSIQAKLPARFFAPLCQEHELWQHAISVMLNSFAKRMPGKGLLHFLWWPSISPQTGGATFRGHALLKSRRHSAQVGALDPKIRRLKARPALVPSFCA